MSCSFRDPHRVAVEVRQQPLVRIRAVGIGEFESLIEPTQLGADRGNTGPGGIDMQPRAAAARDLTQLRHRVDRPDTSGTDRCHDERRRVTRRPVGLDQVTQVIWSRGPGCRIDVDRAQRVRAETGHSARFLHRRVRLARRVHGEPLGADAGACRPPTRRPVNRGQQGDQSGVRCGVLDHAGARVRPNETAAVGRAVRPASRARASRARSLRGRSPRSCPGRRGQTRVDRRGSPDRWRSRGSRRRRTGAANG